MKEFLIVLLSAICICLISSIYILRLRVDWMQDECLRLNYAEWKIDEDDESVKKFTFKKVVDN